MSGQDGGTAGAPSIGIAEVETCCSAGVLVQPKLRATYAGAASPNTPVEPAREPRVRSWPTSELQVASGLLVETVERNYLATRPEPLTSVRSVS